MYMPDRAAVVMLQQRSYANEIMGEFFARTPTKKSEVIENKAFLEQINERFEAAVESYGNMLIKAIGAQGKIGTVLDIGCGMGWADLGLYAMMDRKPLLYLLDGSPQKIYDDKLRIAKKKRHFQDYEFSFDIFATQQLLIGNGVRQEHINFVAPSAAAIENLRSIDLVFSLTSWFWHYPRSKYWDAVEKILHEDSVLIVDVSRRKRKDIEFLESKFRECQVIAEYKPGKRARVAAKGLYQTR